MAKHRLKITDRFMNDIDSGLKTFEIRRHDRKFEVGDEIEFLLLCDDAWYPEPHTVGYSITYILTHKDFPQGVKRDYCVLGIKRV